ncbi:MAG: chloramphenicol acetyltransferase [Saprospiraceae bacterium]|nr:chloramphenicol acetyltransferase [Saprospiraceae bacterium]
MHTKLDIFTWNRKEVFQFFKDFDEPYFGITAEVDVTKAYATAKEMGTSFFLFYLHKSLGAVNRLEPFRYRLVDDEILIYDHIHASATVNREDRTFGYSFMIFDEDFQVFEQNAISEISRIRTTTNLFPERNGVDAVHYSSLPWVKFTSLSHARRYRNGDSVPKISFGKMTTDDHVRTMPCSVHVHHGLVDGKDVGDYFELFQELLDGK